MIGSICANLRTIAAGLVILVSCNTLVAAKSRRQILTNRAQLAAVFS